MHPECPDMILTDLDMPTENGLEFLDRLERKNCQCRHVALMSGKSLLEKDSLRLAESGRQFFPKPFDLQRIYDWIDDAARPHPAP